MKRYLLSPAQKCYYYTCMNGENYSGCNLLTKFTLGDKIDSEKIGLVIKKILSRHNALLSYFEYENNELYSKYANINEIEVSDCYEIIENSNEEIVEKKHLEISQRLINYLKWPLFKATFLLNKNSTAVVVQTHHLVADVYALELFKNEIIQMLYQNTNNDNYNLNYISYKAISEMENAKRTSEEYFKDTIYWHNFLPKELPKYYAYDRQDFGRSNAYTIAINNNNYTAIKEMARDLKVSTFSIYLSVYLISLSKQLSNNKVIITIPYANRKIDEYTKIIGLFATLGFIYVDFSKDIKFNQLVDQVNSQIKGIIKHSSYSSVDYVLEKELNIHKGSMPVTNYMFNKNPLSGVDNLLEGRFEDQGRDIKFDLQGLLIDNKNTAYIKFIFREDIISREFILSFSKEYIKQLETNIFETKIS